MLQRRRMYAVVVGVLLVLAIAVGGTGWSARHIIGRFEPQDRFNQGASSRGLPQSAEKAESQHSDVAATEDLATLNRAWRERMSRITKELTSAKGLAHVLENEFGVARPRIAQMIGGGSHAADELTSSGALAAALDAWCFTGPHVMHAIGSHYSSYGLSLHGVPEDAITPNSLLILFGCGFGTAPGSVRMSLDSSGQTYELPLAVGQTTNPWDKFVVWASVPIVTGVIDQTATVTLTDSASRVSTLTLPFVATRQEQIFNAFAHVDRIAVNPECSTATTDDSCGGAPVGDSRWPEGRTFVAVHWKSCCRSVDGTDIFSIKLNNGWTAPGLDPYVGAFSSFRNDEHGGLTTCWWFGNKPGWAYPWGTFPSSSPDFTIEAHFKWHVDSVCSAAHYAANLVIVGPMGVPY